MDDLLNSAPFRVYPFHKSDGLQLFHVSCDRHLDQGFCGEATDALRNLADHIDEKHSGAVSDA